MHKTARPKFDDYVCNKDTIEWDEGVFHLVARIENDNDSGPPDERDDGFWPSLDPNAAGFIGTHGNMMGRYKIELMRAHQVMNAWQRDEWWYGGVVVEVFVNDHQINEDYEHALWGIEINYPTRKKKDKNMYPTQIAFEIATDALNTVRKHALDKIMLALADDDT